MNILIDIGHPAHVHLFRNVYFSFLVDGHKVIVTVKDIPSAISLLQLYKIPFVSLGKKMDSLSGKFFEQLKYDYEILKIARRERIDIGLGSSLTIAHVSKLCKMKSIIMDDDDDDVEPLFAKYGHPFSDVILSPANTRRKAKQKIFYEGYHELAYLHPNRFVPDKSVLQDIGLNEGDKYFILRFNAYKAHHDFGVSGLSYETKKQIIELLSQYGKVFITTERDIDPEFLPYQLKVSPEKIHSLLYYSTMLVGDSQTMTSEAAVLGVPSIRCDSFAGRITYLDEEEKKYHLTFAFLPNENDSLFAKLNELLSLDDLKDIWGNRRAALLKDKIDVTSFLVWFVNNYPQSKQIMKDHPDYQKRFK